MRVSVVVPVFDPGHWITDLIASLRAQTLDRAEFEVIFVDDGSTDETPALLDAAAAETPGFRVIHTPNSGWPGRPRNIGIDAARGDFVFLADHDDHLAPDALQRLTDFAIEHDSDVVIGRVIGVGRNAPQRIFERTVVDAHLDPGLIMSSLTPQKLYRRSFLEERRIRFPEGRRRLEDHVFVTQAYLRAARVSVFADAPVYYFVLRDDGRNASRSRIVWPGYFANAAEAVAIVDAEASDERTRVVMRSRWLRTEALGRLRGRRFAEHEDRAALLQAAGDFVRQHYPGEEVDRLAAPERLIGRLLLDGRDDDVVALAEWEASVEVRVGVERARLDRRRLELDLRAEAHVSGPLPASLHDLPTGFEDPSAVRRFAELAGGAALVARFRTADGTAVEAELVRGGVAEGVLTATVALDPARLAGAAGRWQLRAVVRGTGRPFTVTPTVAAPVEPLRARVGGRRVTLLVGSEKRLEVRVEPAGPAAALRRARRRLARRLRRR